MRVFGWLVLGLILIMVVSAGGCALGWFGLAVDVVQQKVDPFELQRKYELFKNEAAQIVHISDQPIPVKSIIINVEAAN